MAENRKTENTRSRPRPKAPAKTTWTEAGLRAAALYYMGRYASTEANLRKVLQNKIRRRLGPEADPEERSRLNAVAAKIAADLVNQGVVDDTSYAGARARRLHGEGRSLRHISRDLTSKGVAVDAVTGALAELEDEHGEAPQRVDFAAAVVFARRRRLGPFRRADKATDDKDYRRAMGAFARAGFSMEIARQILKSQSEDDLDAFGEAL